MRIGTAKVHMGVCDASGAVFVEPGKTLFLVADDEDQHNTALRLYDAQKSGPPLQEFKLNNDFLNCDPEDPEVDLEASAWLGNRIFWIGSHSRNRKGKYRPSRHRLLATEMKNGAPVGSGKPYCSLVDDLSASLHLDVDPKLPPKDGGLSIEGLSATPASGELLIGFRSPLIRGKALAVTLRNAEAVVDDGAKAKFAKPCLLDLGGLAIRSIEYWPERQSYFLLAGPVNTGGKFQLMRWSGPLSTKPEVLDGIDFRKLGVNGGAAAEALLIERKSETMYILFDEGNCDVEGTKCKDAEKKSFRSVSISGL